MDTKSGKSPFGRELLSWKFWVNGSILAIVFETGFIGLGKLINISSMIRDIGILAILIGAMFATALYLPKLEFQLAKARSSNEPVRKKPSRLEYDNVLWEDMGRHSWGHIVVGGPLCPKDYTPLCRERRGKLENTSSDDTISDSEYYYRLVCPKCRNKYTFGKEPKTIRESTDEVRNCFEGLRRREQEALIK